MGGVSKTFGGSRRGDVFMIDTDASGQKRVSKALFQGDIHPMARSLTCTHILQKG
jgi:hypothetical protein